MDKNDNVICDTDEQESPGISDVKAPAPLKNDVAPITAQVPAPARPGCDLPPLKRAFNKEPYYTGPLIDTHLHMPVASKVVSTASIQAGFEDMPFKGDIPTDRIVCLFEREGITKAFSFFMMPNPVLDSSVDSLKGDAKKYPGIFAAFFLPPLPLQSNLPEVSAVKRIFNDNPGLFQGYGEARFDFNIGANANPEDPYLLDMYQLADEHNLIVQIHPNKGQRQALERLLKTYPHVIFLAHLMRDLSSQDIGTLLETYPNLYYSLDAEISSIYGYHKISDNQGPTKEEYLKFIREDFDVLLEEALSQWKPVIEAHPDRFTWGTDRWYTWHYDPEVGALVVELGRTFIGHLDPAVQEQVAYKNAETMLKNR